MSHPVVAFSAGTQTVSVKGATDELFLGEFVTVTPIERLPEPWDG